MWRARAMRAEALAAQLAADKAALNVRVAGLAAQVEHLTQTVATLSGLLFGDSSEKGTPGSPAAARTATKGTGGPGLAGGGSGRARAVTAAARMRTWKPRSASSTWSRGCGGAVAAARTSSSWVPRIRSSLTGR